MDWQLAVAKQRFSELVTQALTVGPQRVHRRDDVVVVLSEAEYQPLTGEQGSLKYIILRVPDLGDLDLGRDPNAAGRALIIDPWG